MLSLKIFSGMTNENQMHSTLLAFAYDARYGCVCTEAEKKSTQNQFLGFITSFLMIYYLGILNFPNCVICKSV